MSHETIIERLRKIEALANSGKWGEQENAKQLLNALLKKYKLTLDDLSSEETIICKFSFRDEVEEILLSQILYHITQKADLRGSHRRGSWSTLLTRTQAIDARECYAHYRKEWKKECRKMMEAFVHKNRIYGPLPEKQQPMNPDKAKALMALMRQMTSTRWEKTEKLKNAEGTLALTR